MKDSDFEQLLKGVKELGAYLDGGANAVSVNDTEMPPVREIRNKLNLSQVKFAAALEVSVATLRNWEQQRRAPTGPARKLLLLAHNEPRLFMQTDSCLVWGSLTSQYVQTEPDVLPITPVSITVGSIKRSSSLECAHVP